MRVHLGVLAARAMFEALQMLDGYDVAVGMNGSEKVIRKFYKLGPTRLVIAQNLNALRGELDAFEISRVRLIRDLTDGADHIDEKHPAWGEFRLRYDELIKGREVDLWQIPVKDLRLDENEIPITVIGAINPILTGHAQ